MYRIVLLYLATQDSCPSIILHGMISPFEHILKTLSLYPRGRKATGASDGELPFNSILPSIFDIVRR